MSYPHGAWCISLLGGKLHRDMGTTGTQIGELWSRALELIKSRLQDPIYFDPFFADSLVDRVEGKTIYVVANSSVAVATLSAAPFKDIADQAVQEVTQSDYTVCFIPRQLSANADASPSKSLFFANAKLNSNFTFRNFVVGASNREAYQASVLAAKNPGAFSNPILIYGDSGLGKTHLLQAVGNSVRENSPNTRAIYISSHDFIEEYTRFVRSDKTELQRPNRLLEANRPHLRPAPLSPRGAFRQAQDPVRLGPSVDDFRSGTRGLRGNSQVEN